jgi:hypothetical protein
MIELQRSGMLSALNSRYIYGKVVSALCRGMSVMGLIECTTAASPLVGVHMPDGTRGGVDEALQFLLRCKAGPYHHGNKRRSFLTPRPNPAPSNLCQILGGIADTVAQVMTAMQRRKSGADPLSIEFDDLEKKGVSAAVDHLPDLDPRRLPPPFDFERLTRFMAYGFLIAPVQHRWFSFLSAAFPLTKDAATTQALKRVALDQLIMAPVGMYCGPAVSQ